MGLVVVRTFRPSADVAEGEVRRLHEAVQTGALPRQPGFQRRTAATATDGSGTWLVVELWRSVEEADAAEAVPAVAAERAALEAVAEEVAASRYATIS